MPSPMRRNFAAARLRREQALARTEIMQPTAPRASSAGIMSMSIKIVESETRALIDAALASGTVVSKYSGNRRIGRKV